jgi:ATP adenylyltransferase
MKILHTPWRRPYVVSAREYRGCLFCDILAAEGPDRERYILKRGEHALLLLNAFPYTPGHLMAVPYRHLADSTALTPDEFGELLAFAGLGEQLLRRCYGCRSVHGGANLGAAAGAGVPGHLHIHLIAWPEPPLYERCQDALEPPEPLPETYQRMCAVLAELQGT